MMHVQRGVLRALLGGSSAELSEQLAWTPQELPVQRVSALTLAAAVTRGRSAEAESSQPGSVASGLLAVLTH